MRTVRSRPVARNRVSRRGADAARSVTSASGSHSATVAGTGAPPLVAASRTSGARNPPR